MLQLLVMQFVQLPERSDAILANSKMVATITTAASGSIGQFYNGRCHQTFPNQTLVGDKYHDWCSNIGKKQGDGGKPWIGYSLEGKQIKLTGYSIRNGCCYNDCCCIDDAKTTSCCCMLYSFSLHGSNDNITWHLVHQVQKDLDFYYCQTKTFEFQETKEYRFVRLTLDEEYPGCPFCMGINQVEFYGKTLITDSLSSNDIENDDTVSIIGKIKRPDAGY